MRTKVNKKSGEKNLTPRKETDNDISELQLTPRRKGKDKKKTHFRKCCFTRNK